MPSGIYIYILFPWTDFVLSSYSSKGVAVDRLGLTSIDQIWDGQVSPHLPSLCSANCNTACARCCCVAVQVEECSLWNARLFPVCATREAAAESAVNMLQALKTSTDISTGLCWCTACWLVCAVLEYS